MQRLIWLFTFIMSRLTRLRYSMKIQTWIAPKRPKINTIANNRIRYLRLCEFILPMYP